MNPEIILFFYIMSGNDGRNSPTGSNSGNSNSNSNGSDNSSNNTSNNAPSGSNDPLIVNYTLNERVDLSGAVIRNQQGTSSSGAEVTKVTFDTNADEKDVVINEKLLGVVDAYYDDEGNSQKAALLSQIQDYASKIQCSDFKGKGTVDDYTVLFQAASKIANETKQMELNVDIAGFDEFGVAADELSKLFNSFIVRLQTVSVIDDLSFLQSISVALSKIYNLSEVFGRFKETIIATATIQIPKSSHDATLLVQSVMSNVNCAIGYINHFVDGSQPASADANLSDADKNIINKAVATIDNWSVLCDQGVSIAMSNNADIIYLSTASASLHAKSLSLQSNTLLLKNKLAAFNILQ